jgi:hypothetical protein
MKKAWPDFRGDRKRMVASRVYSIFGYDHRLNDFWRRLKLPVPLEGYKVYAFDEMLS